MEETKGVIYILTNPSFPEYVKIGYADNVERRLSELNRSECIPFAFRIYATYEVPVRLADIKVHSIIDKLNNNLRAIENFNGQVRKREFYAMSKEDAYSILEAIAEIHGRVDKLRIYEPTLSETKDEQLAVEIENERKEKLSPFDFTKVNIKPGAILEFYSNAYTNTGITCIVKDNKYVEYDGEIYSLSSLATKLTNSKWGVAGPRYFKYNGEWLNDIRDRISKGM